MTLNAVIALILCFLPTSIALQAGYVTVVEDRPIMSAKYRLPVPVFHYRPELIHPAVRVQKLNEHKQEILRNVR